MTTSTAAHTATLSAWRSPAIPFLARGIVFAQPFLRWPPHHPPSPLTNLFGLCLGPFGCYLPLFCRCLADPQSSDRTIVLRLFPATCLTFFSNLSADRLIIHVRCQLKHHRHDPRQGPGAWSSCTRRMTHLQPASHLSSLPLPQGVPSGPFCFFTGEQYPSSSPKTTMSSTCAANSKTPLHAASRRARAHEVHAHNAWPYPASVTLVSIVIASLRWLPPSHVYLAQPHNSNYL